MPPAGWVRIVNRLHAGLVGEYDLIEVTNKVSYFRRAIDQYHRDNGTDVWQAVNDASGPHGRSR